MLQLVFAIGGRATAAYVTDVFKGSKSAAICKAGHERLPGAGAGSKLAWAPPPFTTPSHARVNTHKHKPSCVEF